MNSSEPEPLLPMPLALDDRPGPAPRVSRERAAAMIDAALIDFDGMQASSKRTSRRGRVGRFVPTLTIAASMLLGLVGAAAAARFYFHFDDDKHVPLQAPVSAPALQARHAKPSAVTAPDAKETSPVDVEIVPLRATSVTSKPTRATPAERSAPEDLMQKANRLRAVGQFRDASQTYGLVYERFPKSLSAYVARVAAAAIELEHLSNPTQARRLFEQALREQPAGALDLEARQGLSVALRDLEDRPAEVRALQSLVSTHPDSPAARRAQVRLREIDGSGP